MPEGIIIRPYTTADVPQMAAIWNEVVRDGAAFPQTEELGAAEAAEFFAAQSHCGVAVDTAGGALLGMYILHPNNVGRCAHVANASYAVAPGARGCGLGRKLVEDSLAQAARAGFRGLQFNAVVASNRAAKRLYEDLGFTRVGTIPGGFRNAEDVFEDMHVYYKSCTDPRQGD